jgi:hypothetical protein
MTTCLAVVPVAAPASGHASWWIHEPFTIGSALTALTPCRHAIAELHYPSSVGRVPSRGAPLESKERPVGDRGPTEDALTWGSECSCVPAPALTNRP